VQTEESRDGPACMNQQLLGFGFWSSNAQNFVPNFWDYDVQKLLSGHPKFKKVKARQVL